MNKLIQLVTEDDIWTAAEGENDGTPFILRYRPNLQDFLTTKKYNKRLVLIWLYDSDNSSLMPSNEEMELMEEVENSLVDILEKDVQSVLAFVYTGQNQKEWHWYSSNIEETGKRLNAALAGFDKLPIELSSEDDPDWGEYNSVLAGADDSQSEGNSDEN